MKVKDIIIYACRLIGRDDVAAAFLSGETLTAEQSETVETLLYCQSAVEDELARFYFPLVREEQLASADGQYEFSSFALPPVKILSVKSGGAEVNYRLLTKGIKAEANQITVTYGYSPQKKNISDESEYSAPIGERLIAAGVAAEFCVINGEVKEAELWEGVYRREIDRAQKKCDRPAHIPPRRWV